MFTSEPSLIQRIERMITETPVVDTDTDLNVASLSAPDIFALLNEPSLLGSLVSAGMQVSELDPSLDVDERLRRVIPYLDRIRNTAAAWCLYRIFRDLYDFHDPNLTPSNARELADRIQRNAQDPSWGASILRDRCKIRAFATNLEHAGEATPDGLNPVRYSLDLDILLRPDLGDSPRLVGRHKHREEAYDRRLARLLGELPSSASQLRKLVHDWLDRNHAAPVCFSRMSLPAGRVMTQPDPIHAVNVLALAAAEKPLSGENVEDLSRFILSKTLDWISDHRGTLRIEIGGHLHIHDGRLAGRFDPSWSELLAETFRHYPGIRFDLLVGCESGRSVAMPLATALPNVSISGAWRHDFRASTIADFLVGGVQGVPMTKLSGFSSGTSSAEWTYGKFQMARKATAAAFARLIEAGYHEEDEIPPILARILHDTPSAIFSERS